MKRRRPLRLSAWPLLSIFLTAVVLILPGKSGAIGVPRFECGDLFSGAQAEAAHERPWFESIEFSTIERTLRDEKIVAVQDLKKALSDSGKKPGGTTPGMLLMTYGDGTQALFKPGRDNLTEVAAYNIARLVGSRLVPPTIKRTLDAGAFAESVDPKLREAISGQTGSLQYFVRTPYDLTTLGGVERATLWAKIPDEQKAQRDIFNFVFGNWDLHWGNVLVDASPSIVQIDNGVIRSRLMVQYGERPFIRRLSFSKELKDKNKNVEKRPFPFNNAVYFERPSMIDFVEAFRDQVHLKDLANYVKNRLKNVQERRPPPDVTDTFAVMIMENAPVWKLERFIANHAAYKFEVANLSMKAVGWDGAIWIQAIGFQNYGAIKPAVFSKRVLNHYRALTFETLRQIFPVDLFGDVNIYEMLGRRDQILAAAEKAGTIP